MARAARAHGAVGRVGGVAANVADFGIEETFIGEVFAEEVLHAPEAAGGYGAFLGVFRKSDGAAVVGGVKGHRGRGCEGAEEAGKEGGHCGGHY